MKIFFAIFVCILIGIINANKWCKKVLQKIDKLQIKNDLTMGHCNSCNRGSKDYVVSGDVYSDQNYPKDDFHVENLLTWSIPEVFPGDGKFGNYWLAPDSYRGQFVLKFDQPRIVDTITLVNTQSGDHYDRGTNEFKVYLGDSENGPWTEVLHDFLEDPRVFNQTETSVPAEIFNIEPVCAQFVKFQILSWYQWGGGLQYFSTCSLYCEDGWVLYKNKCYKRYSSEENISWLSANFNCNDQRGQLASIPNEETYTFVKNLVSERIHVGGIRTGPNVTPETDTFTWTDGTPWGYTSWRYDQPDNRDLDEFCLVANWNPNVWNDLNCRSQEYVKNYVCQRYPSY